MRRGSRSWWPWWWRNDRFDCTRAGGWRPRAPNAGAGACRTWCQPLYACSICQVVSNLWLALCWFMARVRLSLPSRAPCLHRPPRHSNIVICWAAEPAKAGLHTRQLQRTHSMETTVRQERDKAKSFGGPSNASIGVGAGKSGSVSMLDRASSRRSVVTRSDAMAGDLPIGPLSRELLELLSRPDSTEEEAVAAFKKF